MVPWFSETQLSTFLIEPSSHLIENSWLISVNTLRGLLVVFFYLAANTLVQGDLIRGWV